MEKLPDVFGEPACYARRFNPALTEVNSTAPHRTSLRLSAHHLHLRHSVLLSLRLTLEGQMHG